MFERRLKNWLIATSCCLALMSAASAAGTSEAPYKLDIPAEPLAQALTDYSQATGQQLIFSADLVKGRTSVAVHGEYTGTAGLHALIGSEEFLVEANASGVLMVRPKNARAARNGAAELGGWDTSNGLESVVVTAQKRAQDSQKVPITLTAFRARDLEKRNIESIKDLAAYTPGFNAAQFSNDSPIFAIRGAENTFSAAGAAKPTGIFVDEIYIPRASAANFSLFDVQSVSVLKGPQGTLFGRNVTAGAILVETREPSLSEIEGNARLGVGNYDLWEASGYVSVPLAQDVAGSVSLNRESHDGYGRDILTGKKEDNADSWATRSQLLFKPSAAFKLRLSFDYSHDKDNGRALSALTNSDSDRRTSELGLLQPYDRDIVGGSARMDIGDGPVKLTTLTAYRYSNSFEGFSRSGLVYSSLPSGFQEIAEEQIPDSAFSQEARLSYQNEALDLVTGVFYFQEDSERGYRKYRLAAKTGAKIQDNFYDQDVKTLSVAPFADGTWHVTDRIDLTAGIRFTYESKDAEMTLTNKTAPASSFTATDNHDWSQLTYRAVATYRPTDDITLYGSYATGFTSGGYNTEADQASAFHTPFNPEKSANFELGLKSRFADDRGRFNISAFSTKYEDKQEFVFNYLTFIGNIINAAQATARGVEADVAFSPMSALTLNGTFAYLDGKYDKFDIPGAASATGNVTGNSPHFTYSLSADLDYPIAWWRLLASVSFAHKDSYHPSATLPDAITATNLVGAQLGVATIDEQWRLVFWGRNLTNQQYPLIVSNYSVNSEWLAPPRTFGMRIGYKY